MDAREINLETVAELLREAGLADAYVGMTGGGVATLLVCDDTYGIGPGWFAGPGYTDGRASTSELSYGAVEDDGGEYFAPDVDEKKIVEIFLAYLDEASDVQTYTASIELDFENAAGDRREVALQFVQRVLTEEAGELLVKVRRPSGAWELVRIARSDALAVGADRQPGS